MPNRYQVAFAASFVGTLLLLVLLTELVKALSEGKINDTELRKTIVKDVLELIQPRIVTYEEQVSTHSQP